MVEEQMRQGGFQPHVQYRVKDDYTIMSLVENGLGISVLPKLVLNRVPYRIRAVKFAPPHIRKIGIVRQKRGRVSPATERLVSFWLEETRNSRGY